MRPAYGAPLALRFAFWGSPEGGDFEAMEPLANPS